MAAPRGESRPSLASAHVLAGPATADSLPARVADGGEAVTPPHWLLSQCTADVLKSSWVGCTSAARTLPEVTKRCSVAQGHTAASAGGQQETDRGGHRATPGPGSPQSGGMSWYQTNVPRRACMRARRASEPPVARVKIGVRSVPRPPLRRRVLLTNKPQPPRATRQDRKLAPMKQNGPHRKRDQI